MPLNTSAQLKVVASRLEEICNCLGIIKGPVGQAVLCIKESGFAANFDNLDLSPAPADTYEITALRLAIAHFSKARKCAIAPNRDDETFEHVHVRAMEEAIAEINFV